MLVLCTRVPWLFLLVETIEGNDSFPGVTPKEFFHHFPYIAWSGSITTVRFYQASVAHLLSAWDILPSSLMPAIIWKTTR